MAASEPMSMFQLYIALTDAAKTNGAHASFPVHVSSAETEHLGFVGEISFQVDGMHLHLTKQAPCPSEWSSADWSSGVDFACELHRGHSGSHLSTTQWT